MTKIFVDFHNSDLRGRVRLVTNGTLNDLKEKNITLSAGLELLLDDQDGNFKLGKVEFSNEEFIWVAVIIKSEDD